MMKTASQISDEVLGKSAREYVPRAAAPVVAGTIPERAGLDVVTQRAAHTQQMNPQARVKIKPNALTASSSPGMLSGLAGKFKGLPTWGKAGLIGGAALGAYGLGKHFFGGSDQPKQQYGQW